LPRARACRSSAVGERPPIVRRLVHRVAREHDSVRAWSVAFWKQGDLDEAVTAPGRADHAVGPEDVADESSASKRLHRRRVEVLVGWTMKASAGRRRAEGGRARVTLALRVGELQNEWPGAPATSAPASGDRLNDGRPDRPVRCEA
jgi:hypothetical protein